MSRLLLLAVLAFPAAVTAQEIVALKTLARGKKLEPKQLAAFIRALPIPAEERKRLLALTPATYTGFAARLAKRI